MTQAEFDSLAEYSCSIPTGTSIGTRWKRGEPYNEPRNTWYLGEYVDIGEPDKVGIRWRKIRIITDFIELLIHERLYGFTNKANS